MLMNDFAAFLAGALIAAEIDRLARAPGASGSRTKPAYYCMACPLTFPDAASSNAHHHATGHNQTWRPEAAFRASGSGTNG